MTQSHKNNSRLAYIDTLRGFAACWVLLLHTHQYWLNDVKPSGLNATRIITFIIGQGSLGVDLFIVLSGFCLFYPLVRSSPELKSDFNILKFYRRRAFRLLPAYYASLILIAGLISIPLLQTRLAAKPVDFTTIVGHIFLVQTFFNSIIGRINGPYWSIALEAQLYLVFPLLLLVYRRQNMRGVAAVGIAAAIVWTLLYPYLTKMGMDFIPYYHFPARWIEFIAGMWAAKIVCHPPKGFEKWSLLVFIVTLPVTIVLHTGIAVRLGVPSFIIYPIAGATFASLVVYMSLLPERLFVGRNPSGVLNQIGVISYSMYLLHQPIILLLDPWVESLHLGILPTFGLALITSLPLAALAGYIFFACIERPFIELGKRTSRSSARSSAVAEQAVP